MVVTLAICTCFIFCFANLLFSYSATQPLVWNKTQCQCQCQSIFGEDADISLWLIFWATLYSQNHLSSCRLWSQANLCHTVSIQNNGKNPLFTRNFTFHTPPRPLQSNILVVKLVHPPVHLGVEKIFDWLIDLFIHWLIDSFNDCWTGNCETLISKPSSSSTSINSNELIDS